jgi:dihydrofolate reductase
MENKNLVFIAKSLDGYIADKDGGIDWLHSIPNPDQIDMGYNKFIDRIDAIVMGRKTYETVCGFDIPWPYTKPVFVVSNTLKEVPEKLIIHYVINANRHTTVIVSKSYFMIK